MTYRGWAKAVGPKYPAQSMTATAMNVILLPDGASPLILPRTKESLLSTFITVHCKKLL